MKEQQILENLLDEIEKLRSKNRTKYPMPFIKKSAWGEKEVFAKVGGGYRGSTSLMVVRYKMFTNSLHIIKTGRSRNFAVDAKVSLEAPSMGIFETAKIYDTIAWATLD
jgi:hypothetical protein